MDAAYEITPAVRDDVADILALQEQNLREHGGALSVRLSRDWFEEALADMPILVARREGRLVGYLVSSSPAAQAGFPVIRAMLGVYPLPAGAYVSGPICVADAERGRDLPLALVSVLRQRLPGRQGVTFVRRDNERSMRAAARVGMREVAGFVHAGAQMAVLVYPGG